MGSFLWLLIFMSVHTNAQFQFTETSLSSTLVSVKVLQVKKSSHSDDTTRINSFLALAEEKCFAEYDLTKTYIEHAITLSDKINWPKGKAKAYFKMGYCAAAQNELMLATEYFYTALLIYENMNQKNEVAMIKRRLGDCYSLLGDHTRAIQLNNESLELFKQLKNRTEWLRGFNNLALAYHDSGQYERAIEIFNTGIQQHELLNEGTILNSLRINLAISYLKNEQIDNAIRQCQEMPLDSLILYDKSIIYITLAEAYLKKGEFDLARKYIDISQREISKTNDPNDLQLLLAGVAMQVYAKTNETEKELFYTKKYHELSDHKNAQDVDTRIRNLRFGYENANQKKTIDSLKTNRLYLLIIGLLVFTIGTYLFFINAKLRDQKKLIESQKEELGLINEQLESKVELRTLELVKANEDLIRKNLEITEALFKGQSIERERVAAELHDNLGGTISSLKWRLEALDINLLPPREQNIYISIKEMIANAYNEVRFISHNLIPQALWETGLIGTLGKICKELNESGKITIAFIHNTDPGVLLEKRIEFEIYNICLECLNNILKHSKADIAEVRIEINKKEIKAILADNGIGVHSGPTSGKGLQNIAKRVDQLHGKLTHFRDKNWSTIFEIIISNPTSPEVPDNIQPT